MWDQKNGKFPWKQGTPIFKCKDKECATNGGVIWEPKGTQPATPPKSAPPPSFSNKPDSQIPPLLRDAEAEDAAALQQKIGFDVRTIQKELALYQALAEFVIRDIAPIYESGKVGLSPEAAAASVQTLFINITGGKK
jgi:hypothetical protein